MAEQEVDVDAKIRPYIDNVEDNKLFRFMVGKARMEPLAVSNSLIYTSRFGIAIWLAVSSALVQFLHWWPTGDYGYLGYLRPLPAYAICALPLMFLVDWYNRSAFEDDAIKTLERPDVVKVNSYYSRSPSSGVWIFELGKHFVGLAAVDASTDSLSDQTIQEAPPTQKSRSGKEKTVKGTSDTAVIRHFYIAEEYRNKDAQRDLLQFIVDKAFTGANNVEKIRFTPSPIMKYITNVLREEGFEVVEKGPSVGVFFWKWPTLTYELTRETWSSKQQRRS